MIFYTFLGEKLCWYGIFFDKLIFCISGNYIAYRISEISNWQIFYWKWQIKSTRLRRTWNSTVFFMTMKTMCSSKIYYVFNKIIHILHNWLEKWKKNRGSREFVKNAVILVACNKFICLRFSDPQVQSKKYNFCKKLFQSFLFELLKRNKMLFAVVSRLTSNISLHHLCGVIRKIDNFCYQHTVFHKSIFFHSMEYKNVKWHKR